MQSWNIFLVEKGKRSQAIQQQTGKPKMFLDLKGSLPNGQTPAAPGFQKPASSKAQSITVPENMQTGHWFANLVAAKKFHLFYNALPHFKRFLTY